jgi:hypothetical protein
MASIVQLKRSALSGKVPDTGSLNLGELAVNTYDGKIYFKKSGSIESVESVVTTNSVITGSIRLEGTASFGSLKVNDTLTVNHGVSVISGSLGITSDLTVLGTINARQFNIAIISSSTLFESGSSRFGNTLDDTHSFTGSVNVTGSLYLNGIDLSQGNNSGSFSGSFQGDGSGLRGVVSDDIPRDGWDYQSNSSASINDFNTESDKYHIDFAQSQSTEVGTPVGYKGFLTNVSGSTQILPTLDGIDFVVGNNVVASIGVGGIIAQATAGTVSGSSQLTASVLATTGSNTFRGTQTVSGSILPATDNTYDLGSATYQWRDIYVSSGSLYIDGTKVLGSTNQELQITTDVGQSIKILEAGSDSIILQSADGNIELKSSGGGNLLFDPTTGLIDVRGTLQIQDGNKITSSGGNGIVFGNNIVVSGSIESTGIINGINLTTFSSSIASTLLNQNTATSSYETKGRGLVSGSSQITYADVSSIPSGIVSGSSQITISSTTGFSTYSTSVDSRITTEKGRVDAILLASDADKDSFAEIVSLINSVDTSNDSTFASFYTASVNRLNNLETTSGSVNISISNINTQTGSSNTRLTALEASASTALSTNGTQATSITNLNTTTASLNTSVTNLNSTTASLNTSVTNINSTTASLNTSVSNLNTATSSYETKGRSIVSGSSQITLSSTTGYGSVLNQAVLTTSTPTFAGVTINGNISAGTTNYSFTGPSQYGGVVFPRGQILFSNTNSQNQFYLSSNAYTNASGVFAYRNSTQPATYIAQDNGVVSIGVAGNGTADATISWTTAVTVSNAGNTTFGGTITESSSLRYKENVETIKYGLDKVLQMRGVTYNKKDNGVKEIGVIAEEIYDVLPEVVLKNEEGEIDSVSYSRITAVLIEAIKDLKKEIEDLKANR